MPIQRHLIHLSVVATERQQSHSTYLHSFKEFFPTGIFFSPFYSVPLHIHWYLPLLCRDTELCKVWALNKTRRNSETVLKYLPLPTSQLSPLHPSLACSRECTGPPCTPWEVVLLLLFPNYLAHERHQPKPPDNACGNKDIFTVSSWLPSDIGMTIYRCLCLLLLSKHEVIGNPRAKFTLIQ